MFLLVFFVGVSSFLFGGGVVLNLFGEIGYV